jgi:hypothetical protein
MLSLKQREAFLDRADLIRRLNAVGESQRAALMHRDLSGQADDIIRKSALTTLGGSAHASHAHHAQGAAFAREFAHAVTHPRKVAKPQAAAKPKAQPKATAKAQAKAKPVRNRKKGPPRYVPAA